MKRVDIDSVEEEKYSLKAGDLLFARRSLVAEGAGKCSIVKEVEGVTVFESSIIRARVDATKADSEYLYYTFSSVVGRNLLGTILRQTAVSGITGTDLVELEIPLPPVANQKAIAHILGTLDDKIELNRKTNETLEAMARALFKSWFVDFDPVRAKAEGLSTGLPDEISELFPDSFEESRWGEIPQGWECLPLADRALYLSRGISPAYCEEGGVLVLNQKCVRDSRVCFEKARRHDTAKKGIVGREVRQYDALVNSTGVGTLGRVAMMPACSEVVVVDSHVTVVRGGNDWESFFISSTLVNRQDEIEALGEGSTGQTELSRAVLGSLPMTFPPSQFISAFFDCICPVQGKIEANDQSSIALACIRDTLLPKLISGELRIPDAERLLEEAGV
jgi:type I restriction enzyme S subunit